jgi:hypothetical protein
MPIAKSLASRGLTAGNESDSVTAPTNHILSVSGIYSKISQQYLFLEQINTNHIFSQNKSTPATSYYQQPATISQPTLFFLS